MLKEDEKENLKISYPDKTDYYRFIYSNSEEDINTLKKNASEKNLKIKILDNEQLDNSLGVIGENGCAIEITSNDGYEFYFKDLFEIFKNCEKPS